jgi:protein-L-isoaspartate(D-aspartate) O-methyltransferase
VRDLAQRRDLMVREQIAGRGIRDERVLAAMRAVPRHLFVREHLAAQAHGDHRAADRLRPDHLAALRGGVDERAAGGRARARGARDRHRLRLPDGDPRPPRPAGLQPGAQGRAGARGAIARMRELGFDNVKVQTFDGTVGWGEIAPYDRILVTAGAPKLPKPLLDQLASPGVLVIPEGERMGQRLIVYRKDAEGEVTREEGEAVSFVPLVGRHGWSEE